MIGIGRVGGQKRAFIERQFGVNDGMFGSNAERGALRAFLRIAASALVLLTMMSCADSAVEPAESVTPPPGMFTALPTIEPSIIGDQPPTLAINTLDPTATPEPTATATPEPTATATPEPTATATPEPTATATPEPTATATPEPTSTATPEPTATATPEPTATATPEPTPRPRLNLRRRPRLNLRPRPRLNLLPRPRLNLLRRPRLNLRRRPRLNLLSLAPKDQALRPYIVR